MWGYSGLRYVTRLGLGPKPSPSLTRHLNEQPSPVCLCVLRASWSRNGKAIIQKCIYDAWSFLHVGVHSQSTSHPRSFGTNNKKRFNPIAICSSRPCVHQSPWFEDSEFRKLGLTCYVRKQKKEKVSKTNQKLTGLNRYQIVAFFCFGSSFFLNPVFYSSPFFFSVFCVWSCCSCEFVLLFFNCCVWFWIGYGEGILLDYGRLWSK